MSTKGKGALARDGLGGCSVARAPRGGHKWIGKRYQKKPTNSYCWGTFLCRRQTVGETLCMAGNISTPDVPSLGG